ncbi:MAG: hypothetical protein WDW36_006896 [Sanguina aurantia]
MPGAETDAAQAAAMDFAQLEVVVPNVTAELQVARAAGTNEMNDRMSALEGQIGKLEIVLGALPLWKEDLAGRIDKVSHASNAATDALKARATTLEEGLQSSVANIGMQMTSLSTAVQSGHQARLLMSESMRALESDMRGFKAAHTKRLDELEVASKGTAEGLASAVQRLVELNADMGMMRVGAEQSQAVAKRHGDKLEQLNRGLTGLGMTVDAARVQADVTKAAIAALDAASTSAAARLQVVEQDGVMKALQAEVALLNNGHAVINAYMAENDIHKERLEDKIAVLHGKCDVGPPSLWKAVQRLAQQEAAAAAARTEMAAATRSIEMLQRSSEQAHSLLAQQQQLHLQLVDENSGFADKMARESSRVLHYTDERLEGLSRRYEVEALRGEVGGLRRDVAACLVARGEGGGPELLAIAAAGACRTVEPSGSRDMRQPTGSAAQAGPSPPSLSAAAMLETTAMTQRLAVKLQLLEAAQHAEAERSAALERHYQYMQITLEEMGGGAAVDLRKLKREVGRLGDVYLDVAKQAARSQYVTGFQVINLLEDRINGKAFDLMLTAKVNTLSAAAGPDDLAALRREVLDVRHQLAAHASGRMERRAGAAIGQPPGSPRESTTRHLCGSSASPAPTLDTPLLRDSASREGLEAALVAASLKEVDIGALERKVMDLKSEVIKLQLGSEGSVEMLVQHHITNSLLPEVMERQAGEVKRLGRQIAAAATTSARKSDVKALQSAVAALHMSLDGGGAAASLMHQPIQGSLRGMSVGGQPTHMGLSSAVAAASAGGGGGGGGSAVRDQLQQLLHVRVSTLESALHQLTQRVAAVADEVEGGGEDGEGSWGSDGEGTAGSASQLATQTRNMSLTRTASGVSTVPPPKQGLASLTAGSARVVQSVGGSGFSSSSGGGGLMGMAPGPAMARQRARGGKKAAAAALAMAEVQARCAALERLISEISSLPLPPTTSDRNSEAEQSTASPPVATAARVGDGSPAAAAADPGEAAAVGKEPSDESVAVAAEDGAAATAATVAGAGAAAGEMPAAAVVLKSRWVAAPFGGAITTADLQRQVTELRLRLYQLDSSLPLLARAYELAAVAGQLDQSQGLWQWQWSGGAAPNANANVSGGGGGGGRGGGAPATARGPGGGGGDEGEEGGGGGGSERGSANEPALVFAAGRGGTAREVVLKLAALQAQVSIIEARGVSLEQAWAERGSVWALAAHDLHTELPHLRDTLAALLARSDDLPAAEEHSHQSVTSHRHRRSSTHSSQPTSAPEPTPPPTMASTRGHPNPAASDQSMRRPPASRPAVAVANVAAQPAAAAASPGAHSPAAFSPLRISIPSPRQPLQMSPLQQQQQVQQPQAQRQQLSPRQHQLPSSHPPPLSPPRAVPGSAHLTPPHVLDATDIEVAGVTQALVRVLHAELRRVRHGPLPDGTCDGVHTVEAVADREEALRRLQRQPQEVQLHVELLEGVKVQLDRLVRSSADSPADLTALGLLLVDTKVQLLQDGLAGMTEKAQVAATSLEKVFAELVSLTEGLQTKASAASVAQVEVVLRDMGKEVVAAAEAGREVVLAGRKLGVSASNPGTNATHTPRASAPRVTGTGVSTQHLQRQYVGSRQGSRAQTSPSAAAFLPPAGGPSPAAEWFKAGVGEFNDAGEAPVVRPATGQQSARNQVPRQSSPAQAGIVSGSRMAGFSSNHSLPPQTFHKDKRDLVGEQLAELERREGWAEGGVAALMLHMPLAGKGGLGADRSVQSVHALFALRARPAASWGRERQQQRQAGSQSTSGCARLEGAALTRFPRRPAERFPRIGAKREMKVVLEKYWNKNASVADLISVSEATQLAAWTEQQSAGIASIGLDGTMYDQMLDTTTWLGVIPARFQALTGLDRYFAMARGAEGGITALDMSKYLDTNYHYMVPELEAGFVSNPDFSAVVDKVTRAQAALGVAAAVPILIGPLTFVSLARGAATSDVAAAVRTILPSYTALLQKLRQMNVPEVQIHEPYLTASAATGLETIASEAYAALAAAASAADPSPSISLSLVTFYDDLGANYPWVVQLPVASVTLDFLGVPGSSAENCSLALLKQHGFPSTKTLGAGVVDGRSVWADQAGEFPRLVCLLCRGSKETPLAGE